MRLRRRRPPLEPTGVRIVNDDGTTTPVELVYDGIDADGIHVWTVTAVLAHLDGTHIEVDNLPPRTALRVLAQPPR